MKKLKIASLSFIAILYSCVPIYQSQQSTSIQLIEQSKNDITKSAKSFEGQHKSVLLQSWGAPKSKTDNGLGGEIYYYTQSVRITDGTLGIYINMFVNKEGKVYSSTVKHLLL